MKSVPPAGAAPGLRSISEVERETGIPRATIRIWERRYGFPSPVRDERGERCYDDGQVQQLAHMRLLIAQGHRPAKLVAAGAQAVQDLAKAERVPRTASRSSSWLRLLKQHEVAALKRELRARLDAVGLARFAGQDVPAISAEVGQAWAAGELQVHEEHLFTDCVYEVVRGGITSLSALERPEAPQVLLTTFPQEHHGLGLLMAHAMFALQGCPCVSLGVRLPVDQIVSGVKAYGAELVGLSFTATMNPTHVLRGLEELRGQLSPAVRIWAGGTSAVLRRQSVPGVRVVSDVAAIPAYLAEDFALAPLPLQA